MKVSEILDKAADVIERNGWAQGAWFDYAGDDRTPAECAVCAGGAMNLTTTDCPVFDLGWDAMPAGLLDAYEALARRVNPTPALDTDDPDELMDACITAIGRWNDAEVRTAEQVIAELRAAAATERQAGR